MRPTRLSLILAFRPARYAALTVLVGACLAACARAPETDPRMVSEWMHTLYGVIRAERLSPPVASRLMAYASAALYSGLATANPDMPAIEGRLNGFPTLPAV